jgi:hypothetical protein
MLSPLGVIYGLLVYFIAFQVWGDFSQAKVAVANGLIQDECPEKTGKFIPHSHLDRAYRELCDHEGWKALTWTAIARALRTMTRKKLVKRNGVRFVAYRVPGKLPTSSPHRQRWQTSAPNPKPVIVVPPTRVSNGP